MWKVFTPNVDSNAERTVVVRIKSINNRGVEMWTKALHCNTPLLQVQQSLTPRTHSSLGRIEKQSIQSNYPAFGRYDPLWDM